jgi:hypothetical protein
MNKEFDAWWRLNSYSFRYSELPDDVMKALAHEVWKNGWKTGYKEGVEDGEDSVIRES